MCILCIDQDVTGLGRERIEILTPEQFGETLDVTFRVEQNDVQGSIKNLHPVNIVLNNYLNKMMLSGNVTENPSPDTAE